MVKGLEGKTCNDVQDVQRGAEITWINQRREEEAEGRPHGGLQHPHGRGRGAGTELCSLGTVKGPKRTAVSGEVQDRY